ncbi:MAG TPA: ResB protein required for cytochrome C biosynthesis [Verrucomicrobiales bacterium]|nr:ResB protein required for cytochrome C biosynthesis [Verrucomicrobiales bacterium]
MAAQLLKFISSLRLTVVCLACALVLVFLGTMAQEPLGLYIVQKNYFQSTFVDWFSLKAGIQKALHLLKVDVIPISADEVLRAPWIPVFPGGYLIGWVLLINLLAAHYVRFKFTWQKAGIFMTHVGLILLLLGQFFTEQLQEESNLRLEEGEERNYSEDQRDAELVFIDPSNPDFDRVVAIPNAVLAKGREITHEALPFGIRVERYAQNSRLKNYNPESQDGAPAATRGIGARASLSEIAPATAMNELDVPSAVISFTGANAPEGTWLMSVNLDSPQEILAGGKTWKAEYRFTRHYTPYSIGLIDFRHDLYLGTEKPRNFSSQIRLTNAETGEDREVLIRMNEPLRYAGATYFQASFDEKNPNVTILQVVRNPAWLTPYVAVIIVGAGLLVQFLMHLFKFASRRKA